MTDIHPTIALFQARAELLDMQGSQATLDDAIGLLVAWMDANRDRLTEDDLAVLGEVGGALYRDGLGRKL